ncbi:MAG TPA: STAS/SEC14 domain-containing protein [Gemmatimonadales bacterium]|nr:STAS/SEC14 domain-containing protein [Gemmatimonadales bacterium]
MERLTTVQHRGVPVLVVDYGSIRDPQESLDLIWASSAAIVAQPPGSVRVLMSIEGAHIAPQIIGPLKEAALRNKPHLKGVAVVGLGGLLRVIYLAMSKLMEMEMPAFDTREAALDWLAELP